MNQENLTLIWKVKPTLEELNILCNKTMVDHLAINFTEVGDDHLSATMPVDHRTKQPDGLLHGGASVALAETIGSVAANLVIDRTNRMCVGLEINANHTRAKRDGVVTGTARPVQIGNTIQIWEIKITDKNQRLVCISRLTLAVLDRKK
jgi:1,4-dihydroxy-2-naphthoyl-CoA hydrolase